MCTHRRAQILVAFLALGFIQQIAAADGAFPAGLNVESFDGWSNSVVLANGKVRTVIVPAAGGRALHYSANGENIFYLGENLHGKTLADLNGGGAHGGHQIDIGPELGNVPPHPALWWGEYSWHATGPYAVEVTSRPDAATGLKVTKSFTMDPDNGELGVQQTMANTSDKVVKYCFWDRTLCLNGGFAVIPLNQKSRFKNKWALRVKDADGRWQYDGAASAPAEVTILEDHLIVSCRGAVTKVGADSDAGWIAYVRGDLMYVKYFPYFADGQYADGGCSAEVYFDPRVAEMEPLSPEIELQPGDDYDFPEKWSLVKLNESVSTPEQALAATRKMSPSPFK